MSGPDPVQARSTAPRHLVVLAHPSPGSLNRAIADTYCAAVRECGQDAALRDLYASGFDPVLRDAEQQGSAGLASAPQVTRELEALRACDVLVFVYPIWFGGPPAILKGYVDRVLGAGFRAEAVKAGRTHPLLENVRLLTFSTSATTRPWLESQGQWEGMRQAFDRYLATIFGMRLAAHHHFDAVVSDLPETVVFEHLETVRQAARTIAAAISADRHHRQAQTIVARRTSDIARGSETVTKPN